MSPSRPVFRKCDKLISMHKLTVKRFRGDFQTQLIRIELTAQDPVEIIGIDIFNIVLFFLRLLPIRLFIVLTVIIIGIIARAAAAGAGTPTKK